MLKRHGLAATVVYLDYYFIKADTFDACVSALTMLIALLRKLGFNINWNEVVDLTTKLTFLGIEIDWVEICLRLPEEKLIQIMQELAIFHHHKRASKKQRQSLAGKLNFCASVVYGGRVYSRRIIDTINLLKADDQKVNLTGDIRADIAWLQAFMSQFNGRFMLLDKQAIQSVFTDSCAIAAGDF